MIQNILKGIKAYFEAFGLISKLKLWRFFAIPVLISVAVASVIYFSVVGFADDIGGFISKIWMWEWGRETFTSIGTFLGGVVVVVIGLILYKHIVMALSAPFMSPVSEKIEEHLIGEAQNHSRKTTFQEQLVRSVRINIRNLGKEMLITIPILLLGLIPVIGLISTVLLFIVQAYYAGFGNMDYTLERHFKYRESINFVKKHKGLAIGNGLIFMLFLLVPVIGVILVLPFSVVSATKITVNQLHNHTYEHF